MLAGATGAAAGYYGGKGVLSGGSALGVPGFSAAQSSFTPFTQLGPIQSLASTQAGQLIGLPQFQSVTADAMPVQSVLNPAGQRAVGAPLQQKRGRTRRTPAEMNALQKLLFRQRLTKQGDFTGEMEFSLVKLQAIKQAYFSGAFEPKPQDVYTPTYNLAVAELQKRRVVLNT